MKIDLSGKCILVTGGAGFIGSHLVEGILRFNPKEIRVLDNLETGLLKNVSFCNQNQTVNFINADITDFDVCKKATEGVDIVLHQAALGSVPRSLSNPLLTNNVNVTGFLNVLESCRLNKVKRFIYAVSSSIYGDSKLLPKEENRIGKPLSPYAVTKSLNEQYAYVYHLNYNIETIGLRYFNVFGPRQNPNGAYAAVIPLFIDCMINDKSPKIHGDGNQTRDFTFVSNVVNANLKAMCVQNPHISGQVFNIAAGSRITINEMLEVLNKRFDKTIIPNYVQERIGDIKDSFASINKAKDYLLYTPEYDFNQGIQLTADWFLTNKDYFRE